MVMPLRTFKQSARYAKAEMMSRYVVREALGQAIEALGALSDAEWTNFAMRAGVGHKKAPSTETRSLVIDLLKGKMNG